QRTAYHFCGPLFGVGVEFSPSKSPGHRMLAAPAPPPQTIRLSARGAGNTKSISHLPDIPSEGPRPRAAGTGRAGGRSKFSGPETFPAHHGRPALFPAEKDGAAGREGGRAAGPGAGGRPAPHRGHASRRPSPRGRCPALSLRESCGGGRAPLTSVTDAPS